MNKNVKRWLVSSFLSFLTGFCIVLANNIDSVTLDTFTDGGIVGLLFACVRGGVKGLLELYLATREK